MHCPDATFRFCVCAFAVELFVACSQCFFYIFAGEEGEYTTRRDRIRASESSYDQTTMASSPLKDDKAVLNDQLGTTTSHTRASDEIVTLQKGDLLDLESVDPVLNAKMGLVNDAIDEIGFTMYQAKLFVLNGFGYVDAIFSYCSGRYSGVAIRTVSCDWYTA